MNRALLYLLAMRLKNTLLGRARRPTRLLGLLLLVGAFVLMVMLRQEAGATDPRDPLLVLIAVLALYLVLAVLGGIGEPGLGFLPADLDYVLPGPFRKWEILAYHLARQYAQILVLGLMYVLFLGATALPRPGLAYLATVLCLVVASHLQVLSTLVASGMGDRLFTRFRRASRVALLVVLVLAAGVALVALAGAGDVSTVLARALASKPVQVLLYPAIAAGRVAIQPTFAGAAPHFAGLLACVVVSFLAVAAFPIDLVETTSVTAVKRRERLTSATAGASPAAPGGPRSRGRLPSHGSTPWCSAAAFASSWACSRCWW